MKTIFDQTTRDELISRINTLDENSRAQWGKMNINQMLKHCTLYDEATLGKRKFKRVFIGLLFGKMALKEMIKDENPVRRNMPTLAELRATESDIDVASEKAKWIELVNEYAHFTNHNYVHAFIGKMTDEQTGLLAYKHIDHHLRQFGG